MRRKDKEITNISEIEAIITQAQVCHLALSENNIPYIIPVCFWHEDNTLYIHSAKEGNKLDIIKINPNVCFEMEIEAELVENKIACKFGMKYKNVIGFRQFLLRGTASVSGEWNLVCTAFNLKRLHRIAITA